MKSSLQAALGTGLRRGGYLLLLTLLLSAAAEAAVCAEQQPRDCCYGPVQPGETLWRIALTLRPGEDVSIQQTALALRRLNPEAFAEGNLYRLQACSYLHIPTRHEALSVSRQFAIAELLRHQELLSPPPAKASPAREAPPAATAPAVSAAAAASSPSAAASSPVATLSSSDTSAPPIPSTRAVLALAAEPLVPEPPLATTAAAVSDWEEKLPVSEAVQPEFRPRDPRRAVTYSDRFRSWPEVLMARLTALIGTDAWRRLTALADTDTWRHLVANPLFIAFLLISAAYLLLFFVLRLFGSGSRSATPAEEDLRSLLNRARLLVDVPGQRQEAESLLYSALLSEEEDIRREAQVLLARISDPARAPDPS